MRLERRLLLWEHTRLLRAGQKNEVNRYGYVANILFVNCASYVAQYSSFVVMDWYKWSMSVTGVKFPSGLIT